MSATTARSRVLQNYIDGRWTEAGGDETLEVTNPATGEVLATRSSSTRARRP